jgi:hypothetical protein
VDYARASGSGLGKLVAADFSSAQHRAFRNSLLALLSGKDNYLLDFGQVQRSLRLREQAYLGHRSVEVAKILGCVSRCQDFDRSFSPIRASLSERWKRVNRAYYQSTDLPPPVLLKLGDIYFVYDGHNRVSVARSHGVEYLEAEVVEYLTRLPIDTTLRPEDLGILGAYADFLEKTNLDHLRPGGHIEFSFPGGYRILIEHIQTHHYFLGLERQRHVSWEEAVVNWYEDLYAPLVDIIRRRAVLPHFPGRTEADLYIWIMDHLHYLRERHGPGLSPEMATDDFVRQFSRKPAKVLRRNAARAVAGLGRAVGRVPSGPTSSSAD